MVYGGAKNMKIVQILEKKFLRWFKKRRFQIYIFVAVTLVSIFLPSIPYLNIFVNLETSITLIIFQFLLIFNLHIKAVYYVVVFLFLLCLIYQLLNQVEKADILANYIFEITFVSVVLYLFRGHEKKED